MKLVRRIVLLVVLLLILGGVVLYLSLDRIIRSTVQTQATSSLNLATTLDSAKLALFGGSLQLNGLAVSSPPGFSSTPMLQLGQADLGVNYGQLTKEPIHVANITLDKPQLLIEQSGGKLNFKAAMDQMPKSDDTTTTPDNSKPIKLIIDHLTVAGATVTIHPGADIPGMPAEMTVNLPDLTLDNIGNADGAGNGAAIKDVVMKVVTAMADSASKNGALNGAFKNILNNGLSEVTKNLPGGVGEAVNDLTKNPGSAVNDLMGGMNGGSKNPSAPTSQPAGNPGNGIGNLLNGFQKH